MTTYRVADLRSDTFTKPSDAMRRAMAAAPVGDDVYGEDPTVNELEERAAALLGKEAAIFCASGTMGNLVAMLSWVPRGGEVIGGEDSHTMAGEAGGYAVLVGASGRMIPTGPDGRLDPAEIAAAFRDPSQDVHEPISSLVTIENTANASMGLPLDVAYTERVAAIAHERGVQLHIDGARLFNASVALGVPAADLVRPADSVMIALSKGLACPIGSLVAGDREFIRRARRARKLVGGGWRQAGVIAAAGLVALQPGPDGMIDRLAEDHARARRLGEGLAALGFIGIELSRLHTNFVMFRLPDIGRDWREVRAAFIRELASRDVLMLAHVGDLIRAVTYYGVTDADIDHALEVVPQAWKAVAGSAAVA